MTMRQIYLMKFTDSETSSLLTDIVFVDERKNSGEPSLRFTIDGFDTLGIILKPKISRIYGSTNHCARQAAEWGGDLLVETNYPDDYPDFCAYAIVKVMNEILLETIAQRAERLKISGIRVEL